MTAHNEAKKEDIARVVLMPGDPKRASFIAKKYLTDVKLVNEIRNCFAYTGKYNGYDVTIMASGMGMPSIGIYSYELFNFYDVDYIIRIGTAGSCVENLNLYDTLLIDSSYTDSTYAKIANNYNENIIKPSENLNNIIINTAKENNIKLNLGRVYSTDVFYGNIDIENLVNNMNCVAIDMESFALLSNAIKANKNATALLTISNSLITGLETTAYERENKFDEMVKLALESIKYL